MSTEETTPRPIQLMDAQRLSQMLKWYDQQISIASKAKNLAELNALEAEARAKEANYMSQTARIMAPPQSKTELSNYEKQPASKETDNKETL